MSSLNTFTGVLNEDTSLLEQVEGMPLLDTRIFIGESEEVKTGALISQDPAAVASDAAAVDLDNAVAAPGDSDAPEDWRTRGILANVDSADTDEILRLRGRVNTCLHEAVQAPDLLTLKRLLAAGASPAALDWEGRTPLHLCVTRRLMEPFMVLLAAPGAADVRDASGWPLLHAALLHGWKEGVRAVLAAFADVTAFHSLCSRCKSVPKKPKDLHQDKFHKYVNQIPLSIAIIKKDIEMFEAILMAAERNGVVDCLDGCGKTALYTACYMSNLPAVQALLKKKRASPHIVSDRNETALHQAVGHPIILEYLLDNTDVTSSLDIEGQAPEHKAVTCSVKSMRLLLDKFNNTRVKSKPQGYTPLHFAALELKDEAAAELIIERDLGAIDEVDNQGDTPLHLAVKHNNRDLAKLLLKKGAQLSITDKSGATVSQLISSHFYNASRFFEHVFDTFIFYKDACNTNAILVNVDYRVLTNGKELSQINMLEEFVRCGQSKVLIHPLIESLLHLKWRHFLLLFYAVICVHTIFLFSSTILVTSLFYFKDTANSTTNSSSINLNASHSNDSTTTGSKGSHGGGYWLLIIVTYILTLILLLQEALFINLKRRRYFASKESWVKLIGLVLCAATPPLAALAPEPWPRHAACAALLLVWLEAMFLASRLPLCGYYVLMFGKAISNMLKIFMSAIFLVIAFAFCFMIQYRSEAPFDGPFAAFVKTLVMMSSEFDYEDLFGENHEEQLRDTRWVVRILFVIFVIFVATVFMNFMVGVAVSDVNELNETGSIRRLEKQVELLSTFDALVYDGVLGKWLKNMFVDKRYHESMFTVKANQSTWKVRCWPYPYQPALQKQCFAISSLYFCKVPFCENYVETPDSLKSDFVYSIQIDPPELYNAIVGIANKRERKFKRTKNDKTDKKCRCKIDALYDAIVDNGEDDEGEESEEDTESDDDKGNDSDSIVLTKQMKSIISDMSKVSKENEDMKRSMENMNLKISNLSAISSDIFSCIRSGSNWTALSRLARHPRRRAGGACAGSPRKSSSKHPKSHLILADTPVSSFDPIDVQLQNSTDY